MYYFFQERLDGIGFDDMEYRKYGPLGFGIEIAKVTGRIENPRLELAVGAAADLSSAKTTFSEPLRLGVSITSRVRAWGDKGASPWSNPAWVTSGR